MMLASSPQSSPSTQCSLRSLPALHSRRCTPRKLQLQPQAMRPRFAKAPVLRSALVGSREHRTSHHHM
ncbi:hypothetical protein M3J09_004292 [Ascochyta lentis]